MALEVGDFTPAKGFITRLIHVVNAPAEELERRLGFRAGRLGQGWVLLLLKEPIAPGEFAFAGYTNAAGGRTKVTMESGARLSVPIDDQIRARSSAIDKKLGTGWFMQQKTLAESFVLTGSNRIVKVVPHMPHMAAMPDDEQYPAGTGVPQWILHQEKRFLVAAVIGRGRSHDGGGAGASLGGSLDERINEFNRMSAL
jgi:hypothetical protein